MAMKGPPAPSGPFVAKSKNETDFDFDPSQRITVKSKDWPVEYSHVLPYEDKWVMSCGHAVTRGNPSHSGLAFSSDGVNWTKWPPPSNRSSEKYWARNSPDSLHGTNLVIWLKHEAMQPADIVLEKQ